MITPPTTRNPFPPSVSFPLLSFLLSRVRKVKPRGFQALARYNRPKRDLKKIPPLLKRSWARFKGHADLGPDFWVWSAWAW